MRRNIHEAWLSSLHTPSTGGASASPQLSRILLLLFQHGQLPARARARARPGRCSNRPARFTAPKKMPRGARVTLRIEARGGARKGTLRAPVASAGDRKKIKNKNTKRATGRHLKRRFCLLLTPAFVPITSPAPFQFSLLEEEGEREGGGGAERGGVSFLEGCCVVRREGSEVGEEGRARRRRQRASHWTLFAPGTRGDSLHKKQPSRSLQNRTELPIRR